MFTTQQQKLIGDAMVKIEKKGQRQLISMATKRQASVSSE